MSKSDKLAELEHRITELEQARNPGERIKAACTRREFIYGGILGAAGMAAMTGTAGAQSGGSFPQDFHGMALLIGDDADKPAHDSTFFDDLSEWNFLYFAEDTGGRYVSRTGDTGWQLLDLEAGSVDTDDINYSEIKIGVISDSHYNEEGGRAEDVVSASETKGNWDTFIDDMNSWGADVVVHNGDLVDANTTNADSNYNSWYDTALDYLRNTGGSSGAGLDAPLYVSFGDHEHDNLYDGGSFGDHGFGTLEDEPNHNFTETADTYYTVDVGRVKLVILQNIDNAGNPPNGAYDITQTQRDWILSQLKDNTDPKIVFSHVPNFVTRPKENDKDTVVNGPAALENIADVPNVLLHINSHMHHRDAWDKIRSDRFGQLHNPSPNVLNNDATETPYTKLTVTNNLQVRAEASYHGNNTGERTLWEFGRPVSSASPSQGAMDVMERGGYYFGGHWAGLFEINDDTIGLKIDNDKYTGSLDLGVAGSGNDEFHIQAGGAKVLEGGEVNVKSGGLRLSAGSGQYIRIEGTDNLPDLGNRTVGEIRKHDGSGLLPADTYCRWDGSNWRLLEAVSFSYTGDGTTGRTLLTGANAAIQFEQVIIEESGGTTVDGYAGSLANGALTGNSFSGEFTVETTGGITVGDNSGDADPNTDTETYQVHAK